jgi:hypothetical protein
VPDMLTGGIAPPRGEGEGAQFRTELVPVRSLLLSGSPRVAGEEALHVQALAGSEDALPPIVVHRPTMRVVDGTHRLRAVLLRGEEYIEALSQADRTAATGRILVTKPQWSDRRIAGKYGGLPSDCRRPAQAFNRPRARS